MADRLAQTMTTLAENNRDLKTSLRLMLKYEIQSLLDRLSDLGEESLLLLANTNEGTSEHLGTLKASNFLTTCNLQNVNLKDTFLKFCSGSNLIHTPHKARNPVSQRGVSNVIGFTSATFPQAQANMAILNSLAAIVNNMNRSPRNVPSLLDGLNLMQPVANDRRFRMDGNMGRGHNMASGGEMHSTGAQMVRKKLACRHFVGKGHCWQGNNCSFLHTRDPIVQGRQSSTVTTKTTAKEPDTSSSDPTDVVEEKVES